MYSTTVQIETHARRVQVKDEIEVRQSWSLNHSQGMEAESVQDGAQHKQKHLRCDLEELKNYKNELNGQS